MEEVDPRRHPFGANRCPSEIVAGGRTEVQAVALAVQAAREEAVQPQYAEEVEEEEVQQDRPREGEELKVQNCFFGVRQAVRPSAASPDCWSSDSVVVAVTTVFPATCSIQF